MYKSELFAPATRMLVFTVPVVRLSALICVCPAVDKFEKVTSPVKLICALLIVAAATALA